MPALDSSLPSIRVLVRGWLNCNQVVLLDETENVVIDSGHSSGIDETVRLLALPENLGARKLHRVINTHCHADHMGGNAGLVARYRCRVTIPDSDADDVRSWNRSAFLIDYADHDIAPFAYSDTLAAGDRFTAGGLRWRALPAPGHDMHAFIFWCEEEGVVITGDALWENGLGVMFPLPSLDAAIAAAHRTLDHIGALAPRWVIPGHGKPFTDAAGALERARRRLDIFANDPVKNARHVLKSLFSFALLAKREMPVADTRRYIAAIPCYRDLNERFLGLSMEALADTLVADLLGAGVAVIEDNKIKPTITA